MGDMERADDRKILYVYPDPSGGPAVMWVDTIKQLVIWLTNRDYGHDVEPMLLFAPDGGAMVPLDYKVDVGEWDSNDHSSRMVTVTFPDRATAEGFYRIDGRA